jgi:hypothetical protein
MMRVKNLLAAVRLYGLDVLLLGLIARLLNGLSKKVAEAGSALSQLVARKKEAKSENNELRNMEMHAE